MTIHTERLVLRPWRAADAERLLPILEANQAHIAPWIPTHVSTPAPLPELEQRLTGFANDYAANLRWRYAMFTRDERDMLGEVSLFPRDARERVHVDAADRAEIGYLLRKDMTGQGLVTEAARAMLDVARSLPHLTQVEIRCDARNAASSAIPRRLGFALHEILAEDQTEVWALPLGVMDTA